MRMLAARGLFVLAVAASPQPVFGGAMADGTRDAVSAYRRCVMQVWQPPALALGRSDLSVKLHIFRSTRGKINKVMTVNKVRLTDNALFRATIESAMRAVHNKRCDNALPKRAPREFSLILDPSELHR
jgi:hypothetical protein